MKLAAIYRESGFHRALEELGDLSLPLQPGAVAATAAGEGAQANEVSTVEAAATEATVALEQPPAAPSPKTQAIAVLDGEALDDMIARLEAAELICVDTETDALDAMQSGLVGLAFAVESGHGWYVPLTHDYLGAPKQLDRAAVLARVKPVLEDPAMLRARVKEASAYVAMERLCISPQCGFSGNIGNTVMSADEQFAKLRLVVDTARSIWGDA